jgi:demethylspheroidene O-methyltransferase
MKPAGHTPDHHADHHHDIPHRRLSQVCMPRVGMAQIGWGLPRFGDWVERGRAARDHLLASPRFRRWAAAFPLTRPIARRRSRDLFDLCAGFVYSQVLLACVRLKLFDIVADGPRTSAELARRLALPAESTERLLRAALSLRLLEQRGDDRFGLGPLGAALVDNPAVASMFEHHTMLYADMRDPVALLRGGMRTELSQYWPYSATDKPAALGNEQTAAYTALMAASQPMVAEEVLAVYPLSRHHRLLDVGGGDGTFLTHAAASAPNLQVVLYDLPAVAKAATERFRAAGLEPRARAVGGDFFADPLPIGADVVSLVRVVHDHDDDAALAILRAARQALDSEGTLLIAEPMSGAAGAEPVGDAYFAFYLLAMGHGRARTPAELTRLLNTAGFSRVRQVPTAMPLLTGLLVAQP